MDELPPELLVKILSRLNDSESLARCRVASKAMNSLWREVRTVNLVCTYPRYLESRRSTVVAPFKTVFKSLIDESCNIRSISVGVDKAFSCSAWLDNMNDEDSKDLYLADAEFVKEWLPRVRQDLESLSISDFWIQSLWRKSNVLALISSNCCKLVKLEVKSAWLSVVGLTQMTNLRHLTLHSVQLDDENLETVHECFPFLQELNLIGVGGLKEPRIHFLHLTSCHWTVSNAPVSLAIVAPNLLELKLNCRKPKSLILQTPKLLKFHFSVEDVKGVSFAEFQDLNTLELVSPDMYSVIRDINFGKKIRKLAVDTVKSTEQQSERRKLELGTLIKAFPGVICLSLSPRTWSDMETHFQREGLVHIKGTDSLKQITARVQTSDHTDVHQTVSFIKSMLDNYRCLTDMRLMMHQDKDTRVRTDLISACMMSNPRVRWKWGMWAEGGEDMWISDGI